MRVMRHLLHEFFVLLNPLKPKIFLLFFVFARFFFVFFVSQ